MAVVLSQTTGHGMPSKLVFLPVASPVACTFSSTLPVASKLLNREISQCLTWGQMTADLTLHTHACMHAHQQF